MFSFLGENDVNWFISDKDIEVRSIFSNLNNRLILSFDLYVPFVFSTIYFLEQYKLF